MGTNTPSPVTPPKKAHSTSNVDPNSLNLSHLNLGDTPTTLKRAPHKSGEDYLVEATRTAVWEDLGGSKGVIPEVEYEFFKKHILPPLHKSIDIRGLIEQLKKNGTIVNGRWHAFPLDPYKHAGDGPHHETENDVFAKLLKVVSAATNSKVTGIKTKRTLHYRSRPDQPPICSFDKKLGRPDGYFVFSPAHTSNEPYWRDLATPAEFKLKDTSDDLQSDITQILWDMYQIMREDPRRRFVFGFTIENTQMRVWMANRSEVVVSEPFNFITEHEKFLHFFLSQMYAPPHKLGIDTTMTVFEEKSSGASIYDITVHHVKDGLLEPVVFRTAGLLNDDGAKALRGRGTRIWRVIRLVNGKPDEQADGKVLKDSWIDQDRLQEGEILRQITNDPSIDDVAKEALTKLFLTPVVSGNVIIEEHPDKTRGPLSIDADVPNTTMFPLEVVDHKSTHSRTAGTGAKSQSATQSSTSIVTATSDQRLRILKYSVKQHCRIVYMEECEPLSSQKSLRNVFLSLCSMSYGLYTMHTSGCGWVHRDISIGNILYDTRRKRWVLSDLEYAKRLDTTTSHDVRTGTANFMAIEVDQGCYLFDTKKEDEKTSNQTRPTRAGVVAGAARLAALAALAEADEPLPADDDDFFDSSESSEPEPEPDPPRTFRYNPVHDLESLWWIAVYFSVNKETRRAERTQSNAVASSSRSSTVPGSNHVESPQHRVTNHRLTRKQRTYARKLFYTEKDRILALRGGVTALDKHIRSLPKHIRKLGKKLILLRDTLCAHYTAIESAGRDVDKSAREETAVYSQFFQTFEAIVKDLLVQDIIVSPLPADSDEEGVKASSKASRISAQESTNTSNQSKRKSGENEQQASSSSQPKKRKNSTSTGERRSARNRNKARTSAL